MRMLPLVTKGTVCPHCGKPTVRVRMPLLLRPVRTAFRTLQRRACMSAACRWYGFAIPGPRETPDEFVRMPLPEEPPAFSPAHD